MTKIDILNILWAVHIMQEHTIKNINKNNKRWDVHYSVVIG